MKTPAWCCVVALCLTGCVSAGLHANATALRQDPAFVAAYNGCVRETVAFGFIPDFGITREQHFYKCMRQGGWVQVPNWNPQAIGCYNRIEVVDTLQRPRWGCAVHEPQ